MSTWDHEPDEDRAADGGADAATALPADLPLEASEADAIEQAQPVAPDGGDRPLPDHLDVPLEASEADAIEQALTVDADDDDALAD